MPDSNTPVTQALVPVIQADREAAAGLAGWLTAAEKEWDNRAPWFDAGFVDGARQGVWDQHEFVQAFARHRQSSSNAGGVVWQPIDTAPMTGETILAICASAYTPTAFDTWWQDGWTHYSRPDGKWHGGVGKWFPTHWMPRETYLASLSTPTAEPMGEDVRNMANVGEALLEAIRDYSGHEFMQNWNPADCPSEIVGDLLNALDEGDGWRSVAGLQMWWAGIVTDGEHVAFAQKAEADFDGYYWAVDPEDALEWEPTHCIAAPGETLTTPPTPDRIGKDAVREAEAWLRAISDWLLANDHDMTLPSGILDKDPLDIADSLAVLSATPAQPVDEAEQLRTRALRAAEQFIVNGIEMGYIRMPEPSTPDSAHDTLPLIRAALSTDKGEASRG